MLCLKAIYKGKFKRKTLEKILRIFSLSSFVHKLQSSSLESFLTVFNCDESFSVSSVELIETFLPFSLESVILLSVSELFLDSLFLLALSLLGFESFFDDLTSLAICCRISITLRARPWTRALNLSKFLGSLKQHVHCLKEKSKKIIKLMVKWETLSNYT